MMKLSLMQKVVETVDKEWRSPLAERILAPWGFDPGRVFFVRASANFIFIFWRDGQKYFLRFNDSAERSLPMLEAEVAILQELSLRSVPVALPVPSQENRLIETVETELGTFHAVVFTALPGKHFEFEEYEPEQLVSWGKALGQLHARMREIPAALLENRPDWQDLLDCVEAVIPAADSTVHAELKRVRQWASQLQQTSENYGLIHFDFESDNLTWDEGKIAILDFDDCAIHWYVADIAYALRDLFKEGIDLTHPLFLKFMEGYRQASEVDEELLQNLPWFMRMHDLYMYARVVRSVDILDTSELPDWLRDVRRRVSGHVTRYHEGFSTLGQ